MCPDTFLLWKFIDIVKNYCLICQGKDPEEGWGEHEREDLTHFSFASVHRTRVHSINELRCECGLGGRFLIWYDKTLIYQYLISLSRSFLKISIFSSFSKDFVSGKNVDIFFVNVYAEITDSKIFFDFSEMTFTLFSP